MVDKVKNKINSLKKEKPNFKKYIKCFCENEKSEELYKKNSEFVILKESIKEKRED